MDAKPKPICLMPGCTNQASSRGICQTCNRDVQLSIELGKVTEAELVAKKWLLPAKKPGPKKGSRLATAIVKANARKRSTR